MARISLRSYNREIESLINKGQNEDAIAHCLHILKTFPRHIETYRLLGKAYLESERYSDAADILQRVLSSLPDDFVSQVGMSIIREDEGNLDEAIWHMERAYEVQPSNGAIQGELRRLYGRRDGIEPAKVRLTRGALARMYVKGELYQQAIAEIRAALADSPNRLDLQVLLARAYACAEQRVEAVEVCNGLLRKLPNCLEANRIMSEMLVKTERKEDTQSYRLRLQELDPYYAYLSPGVKTPERVPDQAVMLDKLEELAKAASRPEQPDWMTSLGMEIGDETPKEDLPEWLVNLQETSQAEREREIPDYPVASPASTPESTEEEPEQAAAASTPEAGSPGDAGILEDASIPEWLKDMGWGPATGEATEAPVEFEEQGESASTEEGEALAAEELPDWLQAVAPFDAQPEQAAEASWLQAEGDELASGIQPIADLEPAGDQESSLLPSAGIAGEADIPEWLREFESQAGELPAGEAEAESADFLSGDLPDWLQQTPAPLAETPGASQAEIEQTETGISTDQPAPEMPEVQPEPTARSEGTGGLPDWIRDLVPEARLASSMDDQGSEEEPTIAGEDSDQESLKATLAEEAAGEYAGTEQSLAGLQRDEQPGASDEQQDELAGSSQTPEPGLPVWLDIGSTQPDASAGTGPYDIEGADANFEWMEDLAARQAGEQQSVPAAESQETPAGEEELAAVEPLAQEAAEELPEAEPAELPDWLKEVAVNPLEGIPVQPAGSMPAGEADLEWLDSLTAGQEESLGLPAGAAVFPFSAADEWQLESEVGLAADTQPGVPEEEAPVAGEQPPLEVVQAPVSGEQEEPAIAQEAQWREDSMFDAAFHEADTKPVRVKPVALPEEQPVPPAAEAAIPAQIEEMWEEPGLPPPLPYFREEAEEPESLSSEPELQPQPSPAEPVEIPGWLEVDTLVLEDEELPTAADTAPVPDITFDLAESEESLAYLESLARAPVEEQAQDLVAEAGLQPAGEAAVEPTEPAVEEEDTQPPVEELPLAPEPEQAQATPEAGEIMAETIEVTAYETVETAGPTVEETAVESSALEDTLPQEVPAEAETQAEAPEPASAGIEIPEWLRGIELEQPEETVEPKEPESVLEASGQEVEEAASRQESELPFWQPEALEATPAAPELDLNQASLAELERLPGMGFILAQAIVSRREQSGPFRDVEELLSVPGVNQANLDLFKDRLFVSQVEETQPAPVETPFEPVAEESPAVPEIVQPLQTARQEMEAGNLEAAIDQYNDVIKKRQHLPEVVGDLQAALNRYPQDISLWQALGDAYLRNDQLQEALNAYNKAEEYLR